MKLLLCTVIFVVACAGIKAQNDDDYYADYWDEESKLFDYDEAKKLMPGSTEVKDDKSSKLDETEIQDTSQEQAENAPDSEEFDEYQVEDNRSDEKEAKNSNEMNQEENLEEPVPDDAPEEEIADDSDENPVDADNNDESVIYDDENDEDDFAAWKRQFENDAVPLPVPEIDDDYQLSEEDEDSYDNEDENDNFEEELEADFHEDDQNIDDQVQENIEDNDDAVSQEKDAEQYQANIDQILEETKRILDSTDESFETSDQKDQVNSTENDNNEEEDTPEKVYADLNADLDKLLETFNKLSKDNSEQTQNEDEQNSDNDDAVDDEVQDYEDLFGKPFREGNILAMRDDYYENIDDSNLSEIFKENAEESDKDDAKSNENPEQELFDEAFAPKDRVLSNEQQDLNGDNDNKEPLDSEKLTDDTDDEKAEELEKAIKEIFLEDFKEIPYGDDGLVDDTQPKNEDAEQIEPVLDSNINKTEIEQTQTIKMVDELSSVELDDLMAQFAIAHSEDLDVQSENFAKHVAPIHVTLSVDEPTIITSPNFPSAYPTNNIIDWIFEGPGTGIELNITDFAVNGAVGDYVLVKPGGLDESGTDGLIFSYRLHNERRYRFTDVNRMFVRFEAKLGMSWMTGFRFSVRLIWPLPQDVEDDAPVAEPVVDPPTETMTVNLALSHIDFAKIRGDFKELLADMATAYILDHEIDLGMNTTLEVTQITRTAVCNIQWPNHANCVEVTFGIPLHYGDDEVEPRLNGEDLKKMWRDYAGQEMFGARLTAMGITEFAVPDDGSILMVWLVIAFGVVISMAMLAFALWRFSCFEDYTRMRAYGDTDSIKNEKRTLDLYPTPHQTLPPLYTENDYKWADEKYDDSTRVDMGGFANKSYVRANDELFDLDSDEDVITTRDRYSNV